MFFSVIGWFEALWALAYGRHRTRLARPSRRLPNPSPSARPPVVTSLIGLPLLSPTGRRGNQPTQRISGSFRGVGAVSAFGWPTMIGATGTHATERPSAFFPSGVFR